MDFTFYILGLLAKSVISPYTYVGIALGALFSPLWIAAYNFVKYKVVKKIPFASFFFNKVESTVDTLQDVAEPVAEKLEKKLTKKTKKTEK